MIYETAQRFGEKRVNIRPPANLTNAKQRMTPNGLEREAKLRRHEIKKRIEELRKFIALCAGKSGYFKIVSAWRKELISLYAAM